MSIDTLIVPMLGVALFEGLSPGQLKVMALSAERRLFRSGEALITANAPGSGSFLVVDGHVRAAGPSGDDVYGPGTLIGETAMFVETVHQTTVVADGVVRALAFERHIMHELFERDPDLAGHFLGGFAQRLEEVAAVLRAARDQLGPAMPVEQDQTQAAPLPSDDQNRSPGVAA